LHPYPVRRVQAAGGSVFPCVSLSRGDGEGVGRGTKYYSSPLWGTRQLDIPINHKTDRKTRDTGKDIATLNVDICLLH